MARLIVTTKADETHPIAASTVRTRLGLPSAEDTLLGELLDQVASEMEDEIGHPLPRQGYTEYGFGLGRQLYRLRCKPLDPNSLALDVEGTTQALSTDFWVHDADEALLYLPGGFPGSRIYDSDGTIQVDVDYVAGWVMPEAISTWEASTAYAAGAWARPTSRSLSPLLMECTTAGTSDATEPTWTSVEDATITDNDVTWTQRNAQELPQLLQSVGFLAAQRAWDRVPTDIKSARAGEFSRTYHIETGGGAMLSERERRICRRFRR